MTSIRIGGVPEHFNLPWHMLLASGQLAALGIDAQWADFPGGTGAMAEALDNGQLDLAVMLTEGAVAGIDRGGQYKVASLYVRSPLVWGIHAAASAPYANMGQAKGLRYAISRYGSGSHLMAYVDAQNRGWPLSALRFVVVKDLAGARNALKNGEAELFLWEKFTTKHIVDAGEFRLLGECPTPYPCFVVCVANTTWARHPQAVGLVLTHVLAQAGRLAKDPGRVALVARRYGLRPDDVADWFAITQWAEAPGIAPAVLDKANGILRDLGLLRRRYPFEQLAHGFP